MRQKIFMSKNKPEKQDKQFSNPAKEGRDESIQQKQAHGPQQQGPKKGEEFKQNPSKQGSGNPAQQERKTQGQGQEQRKGADQQKLNPSKDQDRNKKW